MDELAALEQMADASSTSYLAGALRVLRRLAARGPEFAEAAADEARTLRLDLTDQAARPRRPKAKASTGPLPQVVLTWLADSEADDLARSAATQPTSRRRHG